MGMPLDTLTLDQAVNIVFDELAKGHGGTVLTPNVDILRQYRRSPALQRIFETTELLVPDGVPLIWASRLQGTPLPERITGTDMMVSTAGTAATRGAASSVFLGGGRPGVAQRAADHLARRAPGLQVNAYPCYVGPGPLDPQIDGLVRAIVAAKPDIVYVGLPFMSQVHAIATLRAQLPQAWFVGVGASFDLLNGDRPRAPVWMQRIGLEWAHRIAHEPRVWRRYLVGGLPTAARLGADALRARVRSGR